MAYGSSRLLRVYKAVTQVLIKAVLTAIVHTHVILYFHLYFVSAFFFPPAYYFIHFLKNSLKDGKKMTHDINVIFLPVV